jgi:hypothetical protein
MTNGLVGHWSKVLFGIVGMFGLVIRGKLVTGQLVTLSPSKSFFSDFSSSIWL